MEQIIMTMAVFITANIYTFRKLYTGVVARGVLVIAVLLCAAYVIVPTFLCRRKGTPKLQMCYNGCVQITAFLASSALSITYAVWMILYGVPFHPELSVAPLFFMGHCISAFLVECVVFWNGIIRLYISSTQIRLKWKIIGIICGMIPIVHLFILIYMMNKAYAEVSFEDAKNKLNSSRASEKICKTKYPILMVHGVFFRDWPILNYWGRIPEELERNGATIYYGNQESASSVEDSAHDLSERIMQVLRKTGAEKVNIIAHSKGGLDSRYAIDKFGMEDYVASLTTINTPHRGCEFADYLLDKIPEEQQKAVESAYNAALKKIGDENPDFMAAVTDLTADACRKRNEEIKDSDKVYVQSVGSALKHHTNGRFPLNMTHGFVKHFDGKNDGLVGESSFEWGSSYQFLENDGKRGISHADMIDLNRENIKGFDVREFYVQLVSDLREKGY